MTRKLVISGLILVFPIYFSVLFIPVEPFYEGMPFQVIPLVLGFGCLFTALIIWVATGGKRRRQ